MRTTLFAIVLFTFVMTACSQMNFGGSNDQQQQQPAEVTETPSDYYYDFDDILVPRELTLSTPESFIIETPQSKAGVMVFTGRVEMSSLTTFFVNNMTKDHWVMRSAFKSNRTILIFDKEDRYCVVNITDGKLKTSVEIWVTPRMASSSMMPSAPSYKAGPKKTSPASGVREKGLAP
jgi:hypothetical protein